MPPGDEPGGFLDELAAQPSLASSVPGPQKNPERPAVSPLHTIILTVLTGMVIVLSLPILPA